MTPPDDTSPLLRIAERLGEQTGALTALQGEVRRSTEQTAEQLRDHGERIDALEQRNDREDGAAQRAVTVLDRRFKLLGAFVGLVSIVEPLILAAVFGK